MKFVESLSLTVLAPQALLDIVPPTTSTPGDLDLAPRDLELAWREWIERETYKRYVRSVWLPFLPC